MNVMSGLLAVVVAFMIASIGATVLEYSGDALELLQHTNPNPEKHSAEIFNSDVKITFLRDEAPSSSGISLYPIATSVPKQTHEVCKSENGFQIDNQRTACSISYLHISVDELNDVHSLQLILYVQSSPSDPSLQINIPVLAIPEAVVSADQQKLQEWANHNEVGLASPFYSEELQNISENVQVTLGFKWLEELLTLGVFQLKDYRGLGVVVTRPIAMQKNLAEKLLSMAESQKPNNE